MNTNNIYKEICDKCHKSALATKSILSHHKYLCKECHRKNWIRLSKRAAVTVVSIFIFIFYLIK